MDYIFVKRGMIGMKFSFLFLLFVFVLTASFNSQANACSNAIQNSMVQISTQTQSKCISIKNANSAKTYFTADPSFQRNADYNIRITSVSGTVILNKKQSALSASINAHLNTLHNTEFKITLTPLTPNIEYNFTIVHDSNPISGETVIYIGLHSKAVKPFVEPPTCNGCEIQRVGNLNKQESATSNIGETTLTALAATSTNEASQCNDDNRPPESSPKNRISGSELNINAVLRESRAWMENIESTHPAYTAQFAAAMARLIVMHKAGGALDVAHSSTSDYVGSASMGNFLFGANARAMGFSEDVILRGAAFYQAAGKKGWTAFPQGIYNFLSNSGDNPGDPEQTLSGIRYHDEVFMENQSDTASASCIDAASVANGSSGGSTGGGGSGGGSGGGGLGGGYVAGGGGGSGVGTWWCFVQEGQAVYCWKEY